MIVDSGFGTWEPVQFRGKMGSEGVWCRVVPLQEEISTFSTALYEYMYIYVYEKQFI